MSIEPQPDPEPVALRLALVVLRTLRGWTQGELAQATGMAPSVLSEYETGKRNPSRKAVERAARAAGVSLPLLDTLLPTLRLLVRAVDNPEPSSLATLHAHALAERLRAELEPILREAAELILNPEPLTIVEPAGDQSVEDVV